MTTKIISIVVSYVIMLQNRTGANTCTKSFEDCGCDVVRDWNGKRSSDKPCDKLDCDYYKQYKYKEYEAGSVVAQYTDPFMYMFTYDEPHYVMEIDKRRRVYPCMSPKHVEKRLQHDTFDSIISQTHIHIGFREKVKTGEWMYDHIGIKHASPTKVFTNCKILLRDYINISEFDEAVFLGNIPTPDQASDINISEFDEAVSLGNILTSDQTYGRWRWYNMRFTKDRLRNTVEHNVFLLIIAPIEALPKHEWLLEFIYHNSTPPWVDADYNKNQMVWCRTHRYLLAISGLVYVRRGVAYNVDHKDLQTDPRSLDVCRYIVISSEEVHIYKEIIWRNVDKHGLMFQIGIQMKRHRDGWKPELIRAESGKAMIVFHQRGRGDNIQYWFKPNKSIQIETLKKGNTFYSAQPITMEIHSYALLGDKVHIKRLGIELNDRDGVSYFFSHKKGSVGSPSPPSHKKDTKPPCSCSLHVRRAHESHSRYFGVSEWLRVVSQMFLLLFYY